MMVNTALRLIAGTRYVSCDRGFGYIGGIGAVDGLRNAAGLTSHDIA
jgi:hypothetical protein